LPKKRLDGVLKLLAYLLNVDEVPIMKIQYDTRMPYTTIYNAINLLREVGFVRQRIEKGPPMKRLISLT